MNRPLDLIVDAWTRDPSTGQDVWDLYQRVRFLDEQVFAEYEPTRGPDHAAFITRLERWLASVQDDANRQALFMLLEHLYFVGKQELEVLHTSAFEDVVLHWLIDQEHLTADTSLRHGLEAALSRTWFCPITDSMEIARFCHLNHITSNHEYRPDWRSLVKFGDVSRIRTYLEETQTRYLVLLEDFVGTGSQASRALALAAKVGDGLAQVLICPLVITHDGVRRLSHEVAAFDHVSCWPVLVLGEHCHVRPDTSLQGDHSARLPALRTALIEVHDQVAAGDPALTPFGWGDLGSMAVFFTNCPNNVPPALHHQSVTWDPLFPRSRRAG